MPRLLTPASSSDLPARDGAAQLAASQLPLFALPPPAKPDDRAAGMPSPPLGPDTAPPAFSLPPPPTRTRTILQVWPDKARGKARAKPTAAKPTKTTSTTTATATATATTKPQATPPAPAGRKTARRTAHSLIERRRRSKMNEAFAELQGLVPACTGDMHKLAVLQASIDYVRYLEGCVATLQAREQQAGEKAPAPAPQQTMPDAESSEDAEPMEGVDTEDAEDAAPDDTPSRETTAPRDTADTAASAATAALLMLNQDRRGSTDPGRGMRVSDLLST